MSNSDPFAGSTWEPRAEARNVVRYINTATVGPANSLTVTAPAITAQGSGQFEITGTACPYPTGSPQIITFQLYRDGAALPPIQYPAPNGPGDHTPVDITWIDTVTDNLPHVYSYVQTPASGQIEDSAQHQFVVVREL